MKTLPKGAISYGINRSHSTFYALVADRGGAAIQRISPNRINVLQFFTLAKAA